MTSSGGIVLFDGPDMQNRVKQWLIDSGIYQDEVKDDEAGFHYLAEYPEKSGTYIDVICPKNRPETLLLMTNLTIDPEHRKALSELPEAKRSEFIEDLMRTLVFQPVGFMITPDMDDPEAVQLIKDLYEDGLDKNAFMDGLGGVNRCLTYIIWKYKRISSQGASNGPPGTMYR